LLLFIKHGQRLAPCYLLLIVDFAEIENGSLHRFVGSEAMVFYNAEVAVIFTVFLRWMLRRNMLTAACQKSGGKRKTLGLHSTVFSELGDGNTQVNYEIMAKMPKIACHWSSWLTLQDIARQLNPLLRGWIGYYGRYASSALYPLLWHQSDAGGLGDAKVQAL